MRLVVPRARPGDQEPFRTVFRKREDRPRDQKYYKDTKKVHECEDVREDTSGDDDDDDQNDGEPQEYQG
ncbi:MAG: hypothetical protein ACKPKO_12720, partial [Candidatus Fonsibacter sp.]